MGRVRTVAGILLAVLLFTLGPFPAGPTAPAAHATPPWSAPRWTPAPAWGAPSAAAVRPEANPCTGWNGTTFSLTLSALHPIIDVGSNLSLFATCKLPSAVLATTTITWNWTNLPPGCGTSGGSFIRCRPTLPFTGNVKLTGTPTGPNTTRLGKRTDGVNVSISAAVVVQLGADPRSGAAPLTVNFTASINGGTSPFTIDWLTGDQNIGLGHQWSHTYLAAGTYQVQVWVNDSTTPYAPSQVWYGTFTVNVSAAPTGTGLFGLHGAALWTAVGAVGGVVLLAVLYAISVRHRPPRLPRPERWMVPNAERPGRAPADPGAGDGPRPGGPRPPSR